ncbi:MAG: HD domain-containing protein [Gemmatimonadaceae bacterium]|nr:HD domain-containing protein [Gemmatimonadaceae bacterium]
MRAGIRARAGGRRHSAPGAHRQSGADSGGVPPQVWCARCASRRATAERELVRSHARASRAALEVGRCVVGIAARRRQRRRRGGRADRSAHAGGRGRAGHVCRAFADIIDAKSPFTYNHSTRVADVARELAAECGLDAAEQRRIYRAGLLHDIGKLGVSNSILDKNGPMTPDERAPMRRAHVGPAISRRHVLGESDRVDGTRARDEALPSRAGRTRGRGWECKPLVDARCRTC